MIDALIFVSQRPVVITLAVIGALLVMAGSLAHKPERAQSGKTKATQADRKHGFAKHLTISGYAITLGSILLFIIAGFVSDLRP
ncbi:MAG: hypothetical protein ACR2RE_28375 [Geminicoccaceae bacterium]